MQKVGRKQLNNHRTVRKTTFDLSSFVDKKLQKGNKLKRKITITKFAVGSAFILSHLQMQRLPAYTENKEIKQKNVISNSGALILRRTNDTANTRATAGVP
jgi:hypothetical protein